jgi:hypothetical protein
MGVHFFPQAWRIDRPTTAKRKFAKQVRKPRQAAIAPSRGANRTTADVTTSQAFPHAGRLCRRLTRASGP